MAGVNVQMDEDLASLNDLDDLKNADADSQNPAPKGPPVEPVYSFNVRDKVTGKAGQFTSVVPDVKTRIAMGRRRAQLAGGFPWEALDGESKGIINTLVACSFCLTEKPDWFTDVLNARAYHVILVVGEEVLAHHERWFRSLAGVGEGASYRSLVEVTGGVGAQVPSAVAR